MPGRPWLQFLLLGTLLFLLQRALFPPPKPVIGPLTDARVEALVQQWRAATGEVPDADALARLASAELERDLLFQHALALDLHRHDPVVRQRLVRNMQFLQSGTTESEAELYQQALALRLHLGDEVVKRRLIQLLEQLLLAAQPPAAPEEQDIVAEFQARGDELAQPPRYSISQLYFSRDREREAAAAMTRVEREQLTPEEALALSSPFLAGYRFKRQTPEQLARHFGAAFVANFLATGPAAGAWHGPVRSTYGLHYVWVDAIEPARAARLEEVHDQLQRDLEVRARDRALTQAVAELAQQYELRR